MTAPDQTGYVASEGNYNIFTASWRPCDRPKAIVHIVHGYGEHLMRYDDVAPRLTAEGYLVFAHDHYGHGGSDGDRGDVITFELFVRDLLLVTRQERADHPELPFFVLAHSFGGLVALQAALTDPAFARGLLLISPLVTLSPEVASRFRIFVAKSVASICPNVVIATLDTSKISRNEAEVKKVEQDSLCFKFMRAKFGVRALNGQMDFLARIEDITIPLLVEHGTADALTDIAGARLLVLKASSEDKILIEFPDAFHQLHHELEEVTAETFRNIFKWIADRL